MSFLLSSGAIDTIPDSAVLHLDATQITASDGETVSSWGDLSGEGNNLTGSAIYRPSGINGNASLEFTEGNDNGMEGAMTTSAQPNVILMVVQWDGVFDSAGRFHRVISTRPETQNFGARNDSGDLGWSMYGGQFMAEGSQDQSIQLFTAIFDGPNSELREGQTITTTGDPGGDGIGSEIAIGADFADDFTPQWWDGQIGEILVLNQRDETEIANQEQRLINKWGIDSGN